MSTKRPSHLRAVNPNEKNNQAQSHLKTIILTSALVSATGFVAVEILKFLIGRTKQIVNPAPVAPQQMLSGSQPPQLPGAVGAPSMFQSPYAAMGNFNVPNPMLGVPANDDEPPKWFSSFKEEHDRRLAALESNVKRVPHLAAVANPAEDDYDDYEDDETA